MSYNFAQEVDLCHYLLTVTIWAKIFSIQQEFMNNFPNSIPKSQSTNFTLPKAIIRMVILIKLWRLPNPSMIQILNRKLSFYNQLLDMSKIKSSMQNHFFAKVNFA